jgi:hypothetical protein
MHERVGRSRPSQSMCGAEEQRAEGMLTEGVRSRSAVLKCAANPSGVCTRDSM